MRALGAYVMLQFVWWAYLLIQSRGETAVHMVLGEGAVFACILVFGLVRLEKGLRKERDRLERERHMLLGVTHELKTPLAAVQLGVDTLRRVELDEEDRDSVLGNMQRGVQDLERRVTDMLTATRLQQSSEVQSVPFSWNETMRGVALRLEPLAQGRLSWVEPGPEEHVVEGDKELWMLALTNVMENALTHGEGEVQVSWQCDGLLASFEVRDQGKGIEPADRERALKPFSRLKDGEGGTGLGLHLVAQTVDRHGAQLEMDQKSPSGFVVRVVWPHKH